MEETRYINTTGDISKTLSGRVVLEENLFRMSPRSDEQPFAPNASTKTRCEGQRKMKLAILSSYYIQNKKHNENYD